MAQIRRLSVPEFAELASIGRQSAYEAVLRAIDGKPWRGTFLKIRRVSGKGGRSGVSYQVALRSLSEDLQAAFEARVPEPKAEPPHFVEARGQWQEEKRRLAVLRHIMPTDKGTPERASAIRDAAYHHAVPESTIRKWITRLEKHDWDSNALGRKLPERANDQKVWVSRRFDQAFLAAGYGPQLRSFRTSAWGSLYQARSLSASLKAPFALPMRGCRRFGRGPGARTSGWQSTVSLWPSFALPKVSRERFGRRPGDIASGTRFTAFSSLCRFDYLVVSRGQRRFGKRQFLTGCGPRTIEIRSRAVPAFPG